jgi:hypothetical protein
MPLELRPATLILSAQIESLPRNALMSVDREIHQHGHPTYERVHNRPEAGFRRLALGV